MNNNNSNASTEGTDHISLIHQLFELQLNKTPDAVAIVYKGESITYASLNQLSNNLAAVILAQSPASAIIGVSTRRCIETIISVLAILKAGKVYLPIDPDYPKDRLVQIITDSGIDTCIVTNAQEHFFKELAISILLSDKTYPEADSLPPIETTAGAYVLYTSGSTGKPKGVLMGHAALVNLLLWQKDNSIAASDSRTLQFAPLTFDVSFQEIFATLSTGGTLVLINDDLRIDPVQLLHYIESNSINRIFLPFVVLQYLTEAAIANNHIPACLQEIMTAGEQLKITPQIVKFFKALPGSVLYNQYGPTETHVVTQLKLDSDASLWPFLPTIGIPINHTDIVILDEELHNLPEGETGELCVAGISLAEGYLNKRELTAEKFINWQENGHQTTRIYCTGDLARYLPDGNIEYLGRKDTQVKIRGNRVELGEIEVLLNQLENIRQAVVFAQEDASGQKRLLAYLVASDELPNTDRVRQHLEKHLPDFMLPSAYVWLNELPKTTSGKVDRKALPKPNLQRPDLSTLYKAPSTSIEKNITSVWTNLLQLDKIGLDDNFFQIGGNSLLALKTIAELKQQYNYTIAVTKLYQYPTVAGLASLLSGTNKTALLPIRKKSKENNTNRDVAVIGMAGRFPGANTIDEFWKLLAEGRETISFFSTGEIDRSIPINIKNNPAYIKARGIIDGADEFDAEFFGFNPRSAELMDPQHRVFLEIAWEVLEKTGHLPQKYSGTIGVFAGCGYNTYYDNNVLTNPEIVEKTGPFQVRLLNEKDYIATRTAYQLNLQGPAVAVYAACSTSLLAVAQAVNNIRDGQCTVAIAGASSITSPIKSGHLYEEGSIMSNDGHCRPFDAQATGTVFSDGAGIVLLKSLEDALQDGDTIYGVIKGVGINNDGAVKSSFSGPSAQGQAGAIAMAIDDAGIEPSSISYVEAHGTATPIGDPIEIEGLSVAFGEQDQKQFCAIGSIKSNMGHLTAASGVAGLIKTVLALRNRQIPPSLFYQHINPNIDIADTPFYVNTELKSWETNNIRRAGVSSFGVGGTNVHVVVEEYETELAPTGTNNPWKLICWSAKTENSLNNYAQKLGKHISQHTGVDLNDVAYTLQTTRAGFNFRRFMLVADNHELLTKLNTLQTDASAYKNLKAEISGVVFMFPGQGSQYSEMGGDLYRNEPVFTNAVDECIALLQGTIHENLLQIMYPVAPDSQSHEKIKQTINAQPAIFILEYAMAKLWMSWGIQPEVFIGHSIGEFVAAHLAGVFSLQDVLILISERARLVNRVSKGSMLSVRLTADKLSELLPEGLSIAAVNSHKLCVVAGPDEWINKFADDLSEKGIPSRLLVTSHAFHSSMMDEVIAPFEKVVRSIKLNAPVKPLVSTVTGNWITEAEATDPKYWAQHLRKTVRFADGLDTLLEDENRLFLEVGPGNILATLARQHTAGKNVAIISGFEKTENLSENYSVLKAQGQLWLNGVELNWDAVYLGQNRKKIDLPTYAFDHKRYWLEPANIINKLETAADTFVQQNTITPTTPMRKDILINKLKEIFEDAAGIEIDAANTGLSFIEIGFDSLSLTQIATNLKKTFNIPITFRKLFEEYNSLNLLASYLDANLPSDVLQPEAIASTAVQQQTFTPQPINNSTENNDLIIRLISQQLQLLTNQLALIQNGSSIQPSAAIQNHGTPAITPAKTQSVTYELTPEEQVELKKPFGATARIEKQKLELNDKQAAFLKALTTQYNAKTGASKAQTQKDRPYMADPRVVSGFRPLTKEVVYPLVVNRSKGSRVWDIEGNEYIDALNGFGSNFLGYQTNYLKKAVLEQVEKGYEIGPQHELAGEVCKLITEFTNFDRAALCNTGSEAVLGAMRIARTVTGRSLIVAFSGSYHGINDEVIVRGTKKLKTVPAAPGIMPEVVQNMLILDYGTEESLKIIAERAHELAAVLVEPVQSRRPEFQPIAFLKKVREITRQSETVLIFDEVITGFRMHPGGAQALFGIKADLGTYGKVIGGGMPIGAIAGISRYMDALDGGNWQYGDDSTPEAGVTYFAGTFVRHPLALAAGRASLLYMKERGPALQEELNARTKRLADALNTICEQYAIPLYIPNFGSLWKIKFKYELAYGELLFTLMRLKGIHIWDLFPCFLTAAHTDEEVDQIINKFGESVVELIEAGFMPSEKPQQISITQNGLSTNPPVPGAKLGRDKDGNPGWFIRDEENPGKYLQVKISNN
ncbi:amino acid adenylation domain-containing protein [Mucilaginibacter lappiensis]|uniref:Amino acid adenylation domain-containing protein n=1 Tax=Mucilaginibacter lappiensis TaxID=354630 RepID=A0ABR6PHP8_9SPHI|nr:type I polyketide synthase [Mucilaginibacter lappiensis]MBB6109293.1 amino acid adenylation domain-containing protein [Mucilaginibacter lappiensis]SIR01376.1 amino acid adenylation domain-containing protein [Mucilaginibacter lappiensis]